MPETTNKTAHGRRIAMAARLAPRLLLLVALLTAASPLHLLAPNGPSILPLRPTIYVNTNVFFVLVNTHCVYNVSVELKRGLRTDDGRRLVVATVESGRLGIMSRRKSSTVILEDIEELLKGVIAKSEAESL